MEEMSQKEYLKIIESWKLEHNEEIKLNKVRKVFLECLPKWDSGTYKGKICWEKCLRYNIYFIYENIEGFIFISNIRYTDKKHSILDVIYNNNKYSMFIENLKKCALGNMLEIYTSEFKYKKGQKIQDNKRNITITDTKIVPIYDEHGKLKQNQKYYKYKCERCGFDCGEHYLNKNEELKKEYWLLEGGITKGTGCAICCNAPQIVAQGINDVPTTAPWMIPYFQGSYDEAKRYTKCSNKSIYPVCPECGRVKNKLVKIAHIYRYDSISCCNNKGKYPNKIMFNILEQLNIDFETEYSPNWIKPKRYDFHIPSLNIIIEMDGQFHKNDNKMNGQTVEESQFIDNEKDRLASEHHIEVIRIDCCYGSNDRFEYIKQNILNDNRLNELFDLSKIDWEKCNEYALSNLVKFACDLWNSGIHSTGEIGKIMKLHYETICSYLKYGKDVRWCNYTTEKSMEINNEINGLRIKKLNAKPIICINNEMIFNSITECERVSNNIFKIKMNRHLLSSSIKLNKIYKGFTFKLISDLTESEYKLYNIENKLKELEKSA